MVTGKWATFAKTTGLIAILGITTGCGSVAASSSSVASTATTTNTKGASVTKGIKFPGGVVKPLSHPVTVTVADDSDPAGAGIMLANSLGYFKKLGIQIKLTKFNSGADEFTSLANNQIDVGRGLISAALFNSAYNKQPVYLVADGGHNLPGRPYFALILSNKLKGKVTTYKQLKGLKIGLVSFGNVNQLFLDRALAKGGLTNKDVHLTIVDNFSDLLTAMGNGAIQGAMEVEPDIYQAQAKHIGFVFKDPSKYAAHEEASTLMFSRKFLANKPVAKRFILAYLQGVRYFNTHFVYAKKPSSTVLKVLHKYSGDPISLLKHINPAGLSSTGMFSVTQVQKDENWYHQYGTVHHTVKASSIVNLAYAKWADKILGPYHKP